MTDTTMISEREAVLRERAAFVKGTRWQHHIHEEINRAWQARESNMSSRWSREDAERAANGALPLPKVTRPRVVRDPHNVDFHQGWSVRDGVLGWTAYFPEGKWFRLLPAAMSPVALTPTSIEHVTNERIKVWADLLANPTEEVDADD